MSNQTPSEQYHDKHRLEDQSFAVPGKISDEIRQNPDLAALEAQRADRGESGNDRYTRP